MTNLAPVVASAFQGSNEFAPAVQVVFRVRASDPDSAVEPMTFAWTASAGTLSAPNSSNSASEVVWTAPPKLTDANPCNPATITASVKDSHGAQTTQVFSMSCPVPQLTNGSFETGMTGTQVQTVYGTDTTSIPGWTVHPHSVDIYPRNAWNMPEGDYALDLCGNGKGAISQELKTIPGGKYKVSFALAGNPNLQGVTTLRVSASGLQPQDYTFNASGKNTSNMGWVTREFFFTATTSKTVLRFESLTEGISGSALDHVSVWYQ
ncbi:choice-of-anchor C family protein [Cystobacter fuscus]